MSSVRKYLHNSLPIEKLSEKARGRNPDEFYHKMASSQIKGGEHYTIAKRGPEEEKRRKLEENQDLALVGLKRMVEQKKADKIQSNLHLIDFPKQNEHIFFVSDPKEVKNLKRKPLHAPVIDDEDDVDEDNVFATEGDGGDAGEESGMGMKYLGEKEKYVRQLKTNLSENKGQYKKLADAIIKEQQFSRVSETLELEKQLKGKGKKRKIEDEATGKVSYRWFSERKR